MKELVFWAGLFDLYGPLLTEKQRQCLDLYLLQDFSLAEVGEAVGISRQAAHDMVHRAERSMQAYEEKLKLLARREQERTQLRAVYQELYALGVHNAQGKKALTTLANLAGMEKPYAIET